MPMLRSPYFARAKRAPPKAPKAPPKAARASRAQEKGDHNMGAGSTAHSHGNIGKNDDKSMTSCMTSGRWNS